MSDRLPDGLISFGPRANCTLDLCPIEWTVFTYRPSLGVNAMFIALYSVALLVHAYLGFRWKSWFFMWSMILGCVSEIIGYVGRLLMYQNPFSFIAFMIQIICISIAPVFYTAGIYVTIATMVTNLDLSLSRIQPKLYYWVFIICDIASLTLQAVGGAMSTDSRGASQVAVNIALAGLGFQVGTLVIFCSLVVDYLVRYFRSIKGQAVPRRLKVFLSFMSLAVVLILARCAYRVDELSEGYGGHLIHNEGLFIGLEGVLIVIAVFLLCIGHPGLVFKNAGTARNVKAMSSDEEARAVAEK